MSAASDQELIDCWTRLTRDEGGAFAVLVHTPLVDALSAKHPRTNPDVVVTAVSDALLAFLRKPTAYDPAKSPLYQFLLLVAGRRPPRL